MPEDVEAKDTQAEDRLVRPFQRRRQLERDLEHITAEMYKRNLELAETNKTLILLRTIDALVLESHTSLKMVCEHIAQAIAQTTDYPFVGVLTRSARIKDVMVLNGLSGGSGLGKNFQPEIVFDKPLHLKLTHPWFSQFNSTCLIDLDSQTNETLADVLDCAHSDIRRLREALPLKSLYIMKLLARRQIVGLLVIGFLTPLGQLSEADTALMDRLSESIGVALDNKLLFEENQRVLRQLKESNSKLLALDEAKDDFISMASHQLRTPLTSVKGYISLVLEEDAGKISQQQHKLLGQAFSSSQRMVYIIADLLNVSRLRTGKFIMESSPVNLADVVEQELAQLQDTAESRSLKLIFDKPADFPILMLDDTKTRQVIMNFVDNAIYYTPAGGEITVKLADRPTAVELRVEDTGIGVPKSEQPHLFTKFYRAANARKARPDGTGLGLFMAKKVVIAQSGSIIFESHEDKGSTFGFTLNKSKLAIPAATK
ncbi:MAG TPA: HAMP domain-containing sensor histidine kinase [Candidatus Saccharimonadales bacterium]|jgi:signal transduction histidine kinase|nr:HAMP domain-containing sensor histidine kinase [Candidatus Saccharimonadales bacterium]